MQVANKTQLKLEQEKGPASVCLFKCVFVFSSVCVCASDVLQRRAYFSSPYSLSSDRSSKPPSKHLETGTRRGEREDGWERKRNDAMGEKKDGAQRKGGQEKSGGRDRQTEQQHMERHKTERTDERMEPNERRRSVGLRDEREGEATSSSPSPTSRPSSSPRENAACMCVFSSSSDLPALSFAHKDGT